MDKETVQETAPKQGKIRELEEKLIRVRRVFTVVKGGRTIGFNALVVVGDKNGYVGLALGKAKELLGAIKKARRKAEKAMIEVPLRNNTIPHKVVGKFGGAQVILKPAAYGTGIIAGEVVRAVVELAGVKDILSKSLRSNNPLNLAKATVNGLNKLRSAEEIFRLRGKGGKGGSEDS